MAFEVRWVMSSKTHDYPTPQNVSLFGNRVFADIIKVRIKVRLFWIQVGLKCIGNVLIQGREALGRRPCEDRSRDWSYTVASQGNLETTRNWKKEGKILLLELMKGAYPYQQLYTGLLASRPWDNKFLSFLVTQFVVLYYCSPRKLTQLQITEDTDCPPMLDGHHVSLSEDIQQSKIT